MNTLFPCNKDTDMIPIEKGFSVKRINDKKIEFYYLGKLQKVVPFKPRIEFKLFAIDLSVRYALKKSRIAIALNVSRQTLDNWLDIYHLYGVSGLEHSPHTLTGNKARELEQLRKGEREKESEKELSFNFSFETGVGEAKQIEKKVAPFTQNHPWQKNRYAGVFVYQISLISTWQWFRLLIGHFGNMYQLFQVFLLMVSRNIASVEQTKHVRGSEAKTVLGINQFPARTKIWEWFHLARSYRLSTHLLKDYFRFQVFQGIVNLWLWFIDGHRLGYTGQSKLHHTYNTQRQMPEPGRTNMVVCDLHGNISDFEIQEGKGDLKSYILNLDERWKEDIGNRPIKVFDREGDGAGFFSKMVHMGNSFVTWEKNSNSKKLNSLPGDKFSNSLEVNGKEYRFFEGTKQYTYQYVAGQGTGETQEHKFILRRIYLWNLSTNKRTSGLAYDHENRLSPKDCVFAILNRWGASENTFKHIQSRHPYNYQPGYQFIESENQSIANPVIKEKQKRVKKLKTEISKLYKILGNSKESLNKDGSPRKNSISEKVRADIQNKELLLKGIKQEVKKLPKRIDLSSDNDKKTFKTIDNEGKNLYDFVTTAVWNSRNQLIDWLKPFYNNKNEVVDLFYAITECQGWIKSTNHAVTVRIEPLQQASRRAAQDQLCKKLTALGAQTPTGKFMVIEVGETPI